MSGLHLNLHAQLGCRRNVPTYAQDSGIAHNEQTSDILALYQCPSLGVFPLYVSLLIFNEQPRRKLEFWNVLQGNFCVLKSVVWPELK